MSRSTLFFSPLACLLALAAIPACEDDGSDGSEPTTTTTTTTSSGAGGSGGGGSGGGGSGGAGGGGGMAAWDLDLLMVGLEDPRRQDYAGAGDGGVAHLTYWEMDPMSAEYMALSPEEQAKVTRIQASARGLASQLYQPTAEVPGTEVTGTLVVQGQAGERRQRVVIKLPASWNGALVVAGTPGTRNEFSSEIVLASWLTELGYAYVSGDKGMAGGDATLLEGTHPTQHWGEMLVDIGLWARERLAAATGQEVARVYAMGLSNGGYQVRRGLEIDHLRVGGGALRLFDGGIDWAGAYWPDQRVLDADGDNQVTPAEYAQATHLISSTDAAAQAMRWAHDPATLTTPAAYQEAPPFSAAHPAMIAAGFSAESAVIWGAYNTLFDAFKALNPIFEGVGYYNITSYSFRADLLGHSAAESAAYSCYPPAPGQEPPLYAWLAGATDGGWTQESVDYALLNATTGVFSAPLMTLHGERDGFLGLGAHALAYRDAVEAVGAPEVYRLYVIANGTHVDRHADGILDYDFNGQAGDEGAGAALTPMQGYVRRAFEYMLAWVEAGAPPPDSATVATDPVNDVIDPAQISF